MSLWKSISCSLESDQRMVQYYDEKGLLDLRICLAPWIEERIMSEQITPTSTEQYERVAHKFHEDLQKKLIATRNDNVLKYKAVELCTQVGQANATELYTNLRNGLQKEIQLVTEKNQMPHNLYNMNSVNVNGGVVGGMMSPGMMSPNMMNIGMNVGSPNQLMANGAMMQSLDPNAAGVIVGNVANSDLYGAHQQIQQLISDFEKMRQEIKQFLHDFQTFRTYLAANQNNQLDTTLQEPAKVLFQHKQTIVAKLRQYLTTYESLQDRIINELKNWRRQQALAGNGAPFNDNLNQIQRCFEMLELFITQLLYVIRDFIVYHQDSNDVELTHLLEQGQRAQESLVLSAFIVEKQPPQVMKTNTRFSSTVRWLVGSQLGIHLNPPKVECVILSEAQALRYVSQRVADTSRNNPGNSGEIQNNSCDMEYQQNNHQFSAHFRNMQLKKIKRAEKKGTESVMDEKFALLFYAVTTVNDYQIRVWTLSLPVVVIVHGNQEPQSWATITWDNAFADIMRDPFFVTDRVTWCQLSVALNTKFGSTTNRILTPDNIDFLYEKLVRNDNIVGEHSEMISWAQFCKETLPDRTFTFWEWFFAIMKLTKEHLLKLWNAGLITGFINKNKTQMTLLNANTGIGTFLLRFSDSEQGGISVAFVNEQGNVLMLQPWTARDLQIRSLADRIHDIELLRVLHPTDQIMQPMGRDEAFGEFYTQTQANPPRHDGYVPSEIKTHIASDSASMGGNTPLRPMQSPMHPDNMAIGNCAFMPSNAGDGSPCSNPESVPTCFMDESDSDEYVEAVVQYLSLNPNELINEISQVIDNINEKQAYGYGDYYDQNYPIEKL